MPIKPKRQSGTKPVRHFIDKHADRILAEPIVDGVDDLLSTAQTATWLGVSVEFLEIGRGKGYGPPHILLAPRVVRYRRDEVNAWLRERSTANIAARRAKLGA